MKFKLYLIILIAFVTTQSCRENEHKLKQKAKGKLFIIGGGKRSNELMKNLVEISGADSDGYALVLPMASEIPDTVTYSAIKQFNEIGLKNVFELNILPTQIISKSLIDSIKNACLIYITGGDQNRFMSLDKDNVITDAITDAYQKGATISGTSAGAAVMSKKMITGKEFKHDEYTGNFRTIEANNIEIVNGLGLLQNAIIDMHFIKRMRMNRLISVCLENPEEACIGIDESTAILVEGNNAKVYGQSQVIVLHHKTAETKIVNGLLGAENLDLSIYLPGDQFSIN